MTFTIIVTYALSIAVMLSYALMALIAFTEKRVASGVIKATVPVCILVALIWFTWKIS